MNEMFFVLGFCIGAGISILLMFVIMQMQQINNKAKENKMIENMAKAIKKYEVKKK